MMTVSIARRAVCSAMLLASASCTASAWAQAIDGNGVDLSTGRFVVSGASISIGGAYGLRWRQGGGNVTDTSLSTAYVDGSYEFTVALDGGSATFVRSGNDYIPRVRDGSTLAREATGSDLVYTSAGGDRVRFSYDSLYLTSDGRAYRPTRIMRRDGRIFTFDYDVTSASASPPMTPRPPYTQPAPVFHFRRLKSVETNTGYVLRLRYPTDTMFVYYPGSAPTWWFPMGVTLDTVPGCGAAVAGSCPPAILSWRDFSQGQGTVTDAAGRTTTVTTPHGSPGPTAIRYPGSASDDVVVGYAGGRVSSVTAGGVTTNYAFADTATTRTATVTRGSQPARVTVFRLPSLQLLGERWQAVAGGPTYTRGYDYAPDANDPQGTLLKAVTGPGGEVTRYAYDARGNVTQVRQVSATPGTPPDVVTSAGYDATCANVATCNQPVSTTDARGQVTTYGYDPVHGGVTSVTGPAPDPARPALRPQVRYGYGRLGATGAPSATGIWVATGVSACATGATCVSTADETRTAIGYGAGLAVTSVTQGSGDGAVSATTTTTTTYDAVGNAVAVDGPLAGPGDTSYYRYDVLRRVVGTVSPDPDGGGPRPALATRTTYNADGTVASVETGTDATPAASGFGGFASAQAVTSSYDGYHRKVKDVLAVGGQTIAVSQQNYDALGRIDCTVVRMDAGQWSGQADACMGQASGPNGPDRVVRRSYDALDRLVAQTEAYGTAAASTEASSYTANGRLASVTDAKGNVTAFAYDGLGRPWRTCFQSASAAACAGSPADYEQATYAANGDVSGVRLRDGRAVTYGYDGLGRRRTTTFASPVDATDASVSYGYDLLGRMTLAEDANGHKANRTYDALGRTTAETGTWGTLQSRYDAAGRRVRLTWGDGFYVTYEYDTTGAMTAIRENGTALLAGYGYDALGRRSSRTLGNGTLTSYGYDAASRLTGLGLTGGTQPSAVTFAYDPAGRIASRTASNDAYAFGGHYNVDRSYTANGLNQYTASGNVTPTYDARGNLTGAGSAVWRYNTKNQLSGANGSLLHYDPAGRLDQLAQSNLAWEWDGSALVTERSAGAIVKRYVHGAGTDEPLLWYEGPGTVNRRWLDADERGSIVRVTNDAGTAIAVNSYDEFGIPGSGNLGRFQYTGQMWLPELGVYHYKARMYSPTFGRFLQTDPIGYADGLNWYDYVGGDPVNNTDPSGLDACRPGDGGTNDICVYGGLPAPEPEPMPWSWLDVNYNGYRPYPSVPLYYYYVRPPIIVSTPQKVDLKPEPKKEDKYACLKAVGGGAVDGVIDPQALIGDALTAGAWGAARAGTVARAALPLGRALNFAKASLPGLALSVTIQAAGGGLYAYFTDPRCK